MARITIAERIIAERQAQGQTLLGQTSGLYSFRNGSNLMRKLNELGLKPEQVDVRTAARAGKNKNDGYQLLIFSLSQIEAPADITAEALGWWPND